jgi:hypothetical protein
MTSRSENPGLVEALRLLRLESRPPRDYDPRPHPRVRTGRPVRPLRGQLDLDGNEQK